MKSNHYRFWKSVIDLKRCKRCKMSHGQIYKIDEDVDPVPPIHEHCRCVIAALEAIIAGKATNDGMNGADLWLKEFDKLPPYYISEGEALELGWKNWLGNLSSVAPGKCLQKGFTRTVMVISPHQKVAYGMRLISTMQVDSEEIPAFYFQMTA